MPWAQGVGRSNRPAPGPLKTTHLLAMPVLGRLRTCSELWRLGVAGGFEQLQK